MANYSVSLFLVILATLTPSFAIKCFQCNTAENPECNDLQSNDTQSPFYQDCQGNYNGHVPFCRKVETNVLYIEGSQRIIRTCGWISKDNDSSTDKCTKGDTDFIKKITCNCHADGCNSSNIKTPISYLSMLLLSMLLFFRSCIF